MLDNSYLKHKEKKCLALKAMRGKAQRILLIQSLKFIQTHRKYSLCQEIKTSKKTIYIDIFTGIQIKGGITNIINLIDVISLLELKKYSYTLTYEYLKELLNTLNESNAPKL